MKKIMIMLLLSAFALSIVSAPASAKGRLGRFGRLTRLGRLVTAEPDKVVYKKGESGGVRVRINNPSPMPIKNVAILGYKLIIRTLDGPIIEDEVKFLGWSKNGDLLSANETQRKLIDGELDTATTEEIRVDPARAYRAMGIRNVPPRSSIELGLLRTTGYPVYRTGYYEYSDIIVGIVEEVPFVETSEPSYVPGKVIGHTNASFIVQGDITRIPIPMPIPAQQ